MYTIEMIQDWVKSGFRKSYIAVKNSRYGSPHIAENNGVGVLMSNFTMVGVNKNYRDFKPLLITEDNLKTEWEELEKKYSTHDALKMYLKGTKMISLNSTECMTEVLTHDEINGEWIEKFEF